MVSTAEQLVETVIKGIQEKKGRDIAVVDMRKTDGAPASYFVICQGGSPTQVEAIAGEIADTCRKELHEKPAHCVGLEQAVWVAMDFVDVMVHVFLPETREFYDLEHLWEDAPITRIEDID